MVIVRNNRNHFVVILLEFFALNLVDLFHQDLLEARFRIKFRLQFQDNSRPCGRYTNVSMVILWAFRDFLQSRLQVLTSGKAKSTNIFLILILLLFDEISLELNIGLVLVKAKWALPVKLVFILLLVDLNDFHICGVERLIISNKEKQSGIVII